jgi:ubiquitin carboxyl-terminal hydrolase 20/33
LYACPTCQQEQEALAHRVKHELEELLHLNKEGQPADESPVVRYAIAMNWFRQWESFVKGKESEPPGQIDNSFICSLTKNGQVVLKMGEFYTQYAFLQNSIGTVDKQTNSVAFSPQATTTGW